MKRLLTVLVAAMIGSLVLAQQDGGVLRVATVDEPTSLDPLRAAADEPNLVYMQIHDGLVAFDQDWNVVPKLAESWEVSEDGTVYTFRLRAGVTFQNGDPLTAADVKYAFDQALNPELTGPWLTLASIAGVEAVDDLTVVVLGQISGFDPGDSIAPLFHSDPKAWADNADTSNRTRYDSPKVDEWLEEARTLNDFEARLEIYCKAARVIFLEDVAQIPAYHWISSLAFNNNVHDAFTDPAWDIELVSTYNNVWMEK